MEDKRIHLVLLIAILAMNVEIGAKALPTTRFTLPNDDYFKDFIRELSKVSPNYQKLGKFVKTLFEWNGLKETGKAHESPSSYHDNSNSTKTNKNFRRNEYIQEKTASTLASRNRRHRVRDTHANVSIMFFTPPTNIPRISISHKKKRSPNDKQLRRIDTVKNNNSFVKPARKDVISDDEIKFSPTEMNYKNLVKIKQQTVQSTLIEDEGWWTLKKALGICFIFVWLQVIVILLYQFCRNKKYDKYFSLSSNSEEEEPTISQVVNDISSEVSSVKTEQDITEPSKEPENRLKKFILNGPIRVKESQSPNSLTEPEDSESPTTYRKKNIEILKNTFSKILSSEPIPENFPPSPKSKKIIIISSDPGNNNSTETTIEKDDYHKPKCSTAVQKDLEQTHVKQLYYDIKDHQALSEHLNRSQEFSVVSVDKDITTPKYLNTSHTFDDDIKEHQALSEHQNRSHEFSVVSVDKDITTPKYLDTSHTFDDPGESGRNMDEETRPLMITFENNPEVNSKSLQDPIVKSMTEEESRDFLRCTETKPGGSNTVQVQENPYQEQKKRVTFNRVIQGKTFSSKSLCGGEIAETFHRVDGRKPCLKSPSKFESPSNFPEDSPTFVYPRRTLIDHQKNKKKLKNSFLKRLKRKFKK